MKTKVILSWAQYSFWEARGGGGGMSTLGLGYRFHHLSQFCNLKIWPEHLTFNFLILFHVYSLQY